MIHEPVAARTHLSATIGIGAGAAAGIARTPAGIATSICAAGGAGADVRAAGSTTLLRPAGATRPAAVRREPLDDYEAGQLANDFDAATPQELLAWAIERWHPHLAVCTSFQAEGMALFDMAWRIDPRVRLFTVDTGRLPQQTYDAMEQVRDRYGVAIEICVPDAARLARLTTRLGPNLFRRSVEARLACCAVRKVEPIRAALDHLDAWVTGLRRDQWASRAGIRKIEIDHDHGGIAKLNPLADWTADEVRDYNRDHDVPVHPLYAQGYTSIGCAPCTRPTAAGEDPRAGRWWWEKNAPKECGIHCPLETGGLEHELEALLPAGAQAGD